MQRVDLPTLAFTSVKQARSSNSWPLCDI